MHTLVEVIGEPKTGLVLLASRGSGPEGMLDLYMTAINRLKLADISIHSLSPDLEWYPRPNGPTNQAEAVAGIAKSVEDVASYIDANLVLKQGVKYKDITVAGFSAGAVMAIQVALEMYRSSRPIANCVVHSGAVLEPDKMPYTDDFCPTKFHVFHGTEDNIFSVEERCVPMIKALVRNLYNANIHIKGYGHSPQDEDVLKICKEFLCPSSK